MTINKATLVIQHQASLSLIEKEVLDEFSLSGDSQAFLAFWRESFHEGLSAQGKLEFSEKWGEKALEFNRAFDKQLDSKREVHKKIIAEVKEALKKGGDAKEIIREKEEALKQALGLQDFKNHLASELVVFLERAGYKFTRLEDEQRLKTVFGRYLDKRFIDPLKKFSLVESYKAKLLLNDKVSKNTPTNAQVTVKPLDSKTLSTGEKPRSDYGFKLDIDNLQQQLKHTLASLKPDEKLLVEVEIPPDRGDVVKKIAETGFQYKVSFLALLLMIFICLKMIKKHDQTRVVEAIEKLMKKDGLLVNPEEILFSLKARDSNGSVQTVLKPTPLAEHFIQKLNQTYQACQHRMLKPEQSTKEMDDEDDQLPNGNIPAVRGFGR